MEKPRLQFSMSQLLGATVLFAIGFGCLTLPWQNSSLTGLGFLTGLAGGLRVLIDDLRTYLIALGLAVVIWLLLSALFIFMVGPSL